MMRMLCPLSVLFLASVMSHPEYLFNYFCPVNLSFLILKYYRTVIIFIVAVKADESTIVR